MRTFTGALVAVALLAGGTGKANAQGLVEYALILVYSGDTASSGRAIDGKFLMAVEDVYMSSRFNAACDQHSDLDPVCDAVGSISPGTSAALAIATLERSGWKFQNAFPAKWAGPLASSDDASPPATNATWVGVGANAFVDETTARLIGCTFPSTQPTTIFIQEATVGEARQENTVGIGEDAPACVDSLQDALDHGLKLRAPVRSAQADDFWNWRPLIEQGTVNPNAAKTRIVAFYICPDGCGA